MTICFKGSTRDGSVVKEEANGSLAGGSFSSVSSFDSGFGVGVSESGW